MKKILFFRNDFAANAQRRVEDGYGGVGYYRIIKPYEYTKGHKLEIVGINLEKRKWADIFKDCDVFWASYFSDPHQASQMYYNRDKYKKKVIIDLDDNYLDVLPNHPLYDRFKPTKKDKAFTSTILSFADVITVSTEALRQRVDKHMTEMFGLKKKIFVLPNMNEVKDWNFKPAKKHKDKIVIGYSGSNSHHEDLAMMLPSLGKVMDKYPNVYFEIMGAVGKSNIDLFSCFSESARKRSDILAPTWGFEDFPRRLAELKWNIGVAPLADNAFTRCKSHIKWLEYSMYKIPVIASKVYPYYVPCFGKEVIEDGKTGLLVQPNEWVDALEDLILNEEKRITLGKNAYETIKRDWQYGQEFSDVIDEIIKAL